MSKEFDDIFDECLERLLTKGATIEQCLQDYPEHADELRPLLETALVAGKVADIKPDPEFKGRARYQFRTEVQEVISGKRRPATRLFPTWATVVATVAAVVLAGGSTVAASSYSMPNEPLYPMKLAAEQVQLTMALSDADKANLCAEFTDRRVEEIIYMAERGDAQQVEIITGRLDDRLEELAALASSSKDDEPLLTLAPPAEQTQTEEAADDWDDDEIDGGSDASANGQKKLRTTVECLANSNNQALNDALENAPESTKDALRESIAVSEEGYQEALEAMK